MHPNLLSCLCGRAPTEGRPVHSEVQDEAGAGEEGAGEHDHLKTIVQGYSILTVTVPDPGLNGNLASGPFGFLIEYLCHSPYQTPSTHDLLGEV